MAWEAGSTLSDDVSRKLGVAQYMRLRSNSDLKGKERKPQLLTRNLGKENITFRIVKLT